MTGRAVPEWIGKTPDTKIPERVQLRIWEREGGRCYLSGRKIRPPADAYDFEHKIALSLWIGEGHGNRESNIFLALRDKHREKTKLDVAEKARSDRTRKAHLGITRAKRKIESRGFEKTARSKPATSPLTPKFEGDIMAKARGT